MSIFDIATVECPACGTESEFDLVLSVNADRRPDLRAQILDGTFQAVPCPSCGGLVRLPPAFTYMELRRGHWIAVHPAEEADGWRAHEASDLALFTETLGAAAPPQARELGEGLVPRVVFGWAALQEKLLLTELGLEDATLELLKLALVRDTDGLVLTADAEMRLSGGDTDSLLFDWLRAENTEVLTSFKVPRAAYAAIADDPAGWEELRARVAGPAFTDLRRATLEGTAPEPA